MFALAVITAGAIGYGLRWLQVAVRPDVSGWSIKRRLNRNRAVFVEACVARRPVIMRGPYR